MIKIKEMFPREMILKTSKNAKSKSQSLQKKKWKQSEWLDGKEGSVVDILSLGPALPNLGAEL